MLVLVLSVRSLKLEICEEKLEPLYKKRADQLLRESKSAENRVRLMERTNADLVKQIHAEKERVRMLEDRFNELAGNHQDMIKFKVNFFLSPM